MCDVVHMSTDREGSVKVTYGRAIQGDGQHILLVWGFNIPEGALNAGCCFYRSAKNQLG